MENAVQVYSMSVLAIGVILLIVIWRLSVSVTRLMHEVNELIKDVNSQFDEKDG